VATLARDPKTLSRIERWLADLEPQIDRNMAIARFMGACTALEREEFRFAWNALWCRPNQRLPDGTWDTLFVRAGRGFGKTRMGSEGVRKLVTNGQAGRLTIIAPTASDARDVMIEDPTSGLLAVHPPNVRPEYSPSKRLLEWPNGAVGRVRSAEEPDGLRGLNSDLVWGDEPASWKSGRAAWDNAMLGNRIGTPRSILTGTPRPLPWLREIEKAEGTRVLTGSTYDNIANLAPAFIALVLGRYEGTRLGQQELHAQYLDDVEGALWRLAVIESSRFTAWDTTNPWGSVAAQATLERRLLLGLGGWMPDKGERRPWVTFVGVDPPGETAECGIIIGTAPRGGRASYDHAVILDDYSLAGPPEVWGARVVEAVRKYQADGVVVEANQGGDMTRSTIHAVDPNVPVEKIRAKESKSDRAEPVSTLYSRGWIHHYGIMSALESQQTTWVPDESKSPDRLDALVHLVTRLLKPTQLKRARAHMPRAA
jgi:phage terminase large subunit-like protein